MFEQGKGRMNWMDWMDQNQYNGHNCQMFERGRGDTFLAPTAPPSQEAGRNSDMVTMMTMMNMTMMNMMTIPWHPLHKRLAAIPTC